MTIMNYTEMINNANIIKELANKTIECSKDYVDARKNDIIDQMMDYLMETISDVFASNLDRDESFRKRANAGYGLSFARFGGRGVGARLQFWYNQDGTYLRVFFNETGYWYDAKEISNDGLKNLIDIWDEYKLSWDSAITSGIRHMNSAKVHELEKQLAIHEMVKNFKI